MQMSQGFRCRGAGGEAIVNGCDPLAIFLMQLWGRLVSVRESADLFEIKARVIVMRTSALSLAARSGFQVHYRVVPDSDRQQLQMRERRGLAMEIKDTEPGCRRHVVLVAPEVHWNTGNVGRTCLGAGAVLHLIKPLGFSLEDRQVRRAGLDYWAKVPLMVWDDFEHFEGRMRPADNEIVLLTKNGRHPYWQMPAPPRLFLVFGSETRGLPPAVLERYAHNTYRIPIDHHIRCLNLSTAVGIALFENGYLPC